MVSFKKVFTVLLFIFININSYSQIDDIKELADSSANSNTNSFFNTSSDNSTMSDALISSVFSCCWDIGIQVFTTILIEHHKEIMNLKNIDPSVLSLDLRANFTLGLHHSMDTNHISVNYLPGVRGNIGIFSSDFRFNMLTEYTNDMPNSFKSWEWLFLLNIKPSETFRITFGTGMQKENSTGNIYNQHYLGFKIGVLNNKDYIEADTRLSTNYATENFPFFEGAISYNTRIINFDFANVYIRIGGIYQNYYSAYDIWAANGGIIFNLH